jgi:hypothetical protein
MTDAAEAMTLQARALCIQAALTTRREQTTPEDIIAKAEVYWAWVSQAPAGNPAATPDPLTGRKRHRRAAGCGQGSGSA